MTMTAVAARVVVKSVEGQNVVVNPVGTTYELHLTLAGAAPATGQTVNGVVKARVRKLWTVNAGGNFVTPIAGEPRVIQGRVKQADGLQAVIQAGLPISVELPEDPVCYDLVNGPVGVGALVNVTVYPGATFELA